jgi:hypothetical protein
MPFTGTAVNTEGPVGAGLDAILTQDSRVVHFASGVNFDQDYEIEGIRTLGFHGDRFFKSMGYTASATVETYVLRGQDVEGALATPGWQSDGTFNLNTAGEFDFVISDVNTLDALFTLRGTKLSNESVAFPARGLNTKTTNWRISRIIPGITS